MSCAAPWDELSALLKKEIVSGCLRLHVQHFFRVRRKAKPTNNVFLRYKSEFLTQRKESRGIRSRGERTGWFFPFHSLDHMLLGVNPGMDIFGRPKSFSPIVEICSAIPRDCLGYPLGLSGSDGQLLLTRDQTVISLGLLPSLPPSWSTRMCGLGTRNLLIFLHTEDKA